MTRVDDAPGSRTAGSRDRGGVLRDRIAPDRTRVRRDHDDLLCAAERIREALGLSEVAAANADTTCGDVGGFAWIAYAYADLVRRELLQKSVDDGPSQLAGGAGYDDHCTLSVIADNKITLSRSR